MRHTLAWVATAFFSLALHASSALADDPDPKLLYDRGVEAFNAGRFAEASAAFRAAYAAKPAWKILYNIGQSEAAAKRYGLALEAFEEYLAQAGDELTIKRRKQVLEEVERLRKMVGFVKVVAPDGAVIVIDGEARGELPGRAEVPVAIGPGHVVEVTAGGETLLEREVKVFGGKTVELVYEAPAAEPVEEPAAEPAGQPVEEEPIAEPIEEGPAGLAVAGWIALGAGAAMLAAGGVTGGLALSRDEDLAGSCDGTVCPSDKRDEIDSMRNLGIAADVLFGVGGAVAATGIVLLIVSATGDEPDSAGDAVAVVPVGGSGLAGVELRGRF